MSRSIGSLHEYSSVYQRWRTSCNYYLKRNLVIALTISTGSRKPSHQAIAFAAELAKKHVNALGMPHVTEGLTDLIEYLRDRVMVIWVRMPEDTNAFTIFEALNDRGLNLAISDLLKNYVSSQVRYALARRA